MTAANGRARPPVVVLGAGLAGLTAARELRRRSVPVRVFEAGKQIAGLAGSFRDEDGFVHDFGAHFITNRLAAAIGVGSRCRDVKHYGETVLLNGRYYPYPFGDPLATAMDEDDRPAPRDRGHLVEHLALLGDGRATQLDDEDLAHVVYSEFSIT